MGQLSVREAADLAWDVRQRVRKDLLTQIPDTPPESWPGADDELPVERFKRGFLQKVQLAAGIVGGGDDLTITTVETAVGVAVPLGSFDNLLAVTPSFRVDYLDGPADPDVPEQLYETGVSFFWRKELNERWGAMAIVSPMVRSDFEATDHQMRVFGLGLVTWDWIPDELELSMGVVYLDRDDISLLPALGLKWTPNPYWQLDLMFPRPRLSYRLDKQGACSETWAYLGGSLGGNTWSVLRADGTNDQLTLRDYRLVLGVEQIRAGGGGWFAEVGYVFGRELEYAGDGREREFDAALVGRLGWAY